MGKPLPRNNRKNLVPFLLMFPQGSIHLELLSTDITQPARFFVIIHVEKTLRAMTGEMCGKDFMKILKITKHIKRQHERFFDSQAKI